MVLIQSKRLSLSAQSAYVAQRNNCNNPMYECVSVSRACIYASVSSILLKYAEGNWNTLIISGKFFQVEWTFVIFLFIDVDYGIDRALLFLSCEIARCCRHSHAVLSPQWGQCLTQIIYMEISPSTNISSQYCHISLCYQFFFFLS